MKIAFCIDAVWPYRVPLYRKLSKLYDVDFLLTGQKEIEELKRIDKSNHLNFKVFRNYDIFSLKISLGLSLIHI